MFRVNNNSDNSAKPRQEKTQLEKFRITSRSSDITFQIMVQMFRFNKEASKISFNKSEIENPTSNYNYSSVDQSYISKQEEFSCGLHLLNVYGQNSINLKNDNVQIDSKILHISDNFKEQKTRRYYNTVNTPKCTFATDKYGKITHTAQAEIET